MTIDEESQATGPTHSRADRFTTDTPELRPPRSLRAKQQTRGHRRADRKAVDEPVAPEPETMVDGDG